MASKTILADVCEHKKFGEIYLVPQDIIEIKEGWNARTDFSGQDELANYITENGFPGSIEVYKTPDKRLLLVDGERRLRALRQAIENGAEIRMVPITVARKGTSEIDLYLSHISRNAGKPFTATEEAESYRRLADWGFEIKEIAEKTGKSISHVRNRLELACASPELRKAVDAGDVPVTAAQKIIKESGGTVDGQSDGLKKARSKPTRNKIIFSYKNGELRKTGVKDACIPVIEEFMTDKIKELIRNDGFNPETLRVSVEKL